MIQTSFFAGKAPRERKVSIAKWPPRNWQGARAFSLAPSNPKAEDWAGAYRRDLEERFPTPQSLQKILREIERETPNPILCCYELNPAECHRRILADYIKEMLNINVPEWQSKAPTQGKLL